MARDSPFADLADGPAADALVLEVGRLSRRALGCFGLTTLSLALVAAGALSFAVAGGPPGSPATLRTLAWVLGAVFVLLVLVLLAAAVRAVRTSRGLAVDGTGAWWRDGAVVVTVPWPDVAAAQVITPKKLRGQRSSAPLTPSLQLCPPDLATLKRYPALTGQVIAAEPWRPDLPGLRLRFHLPSAAAAELASEAVARHAPAVWAAGHPAPDETGETT